MARRQLSLPAAVFVGGAMAIGLASIGIALIDHKRATARGERMAQPAKKFVSPIDYVFLVGAGTYALYQTMTTAIELKDWL